GSILRKIRMETKKQAFFFSLDTPPVNINLDPKNWILKNLKFRKPVEMHIHQLKHDENAMERIRAAQELEGLTTADAIRALGESIDQDKFWGVRLEAARALGKIGTKAAFEVLLSKVNHKDHKARRGVAAGLRGFNGTEVSEAAVEALVKLLENDQSYYTRAYAAHSLGYYKKSEIAFQALKANLAQDSHNDIVRYGIFQGFGEMGDPRAIPLAIDYLQHGKHFYGRMYAAYALGRIGKGDQKALDVLLETRREGDVHVKEAAAESVALLNDTSAIPSLEEWLSKEMEGRVRRMLRESIYNLKERLLQTEQLSKISGDVEKISSDAKRANERISSLEASVLHNT
ncbi:MAG: HEAT repeat domain-containing protein, partial [Nitrososphaerales archaeon]